MVLNQRKTMTNYYPRLRDLREDHDLSQRTLAEYLGMPQTQYSRYERGVRDIPTDILGSYTGVPLNPFDTPVQDADDL